MDCRPPLPISVSNIDLLRNWLHGFSPARKRRLPLPRRDRFPLPRRRLFHLSRKIREHRSSQPRAEFTKMQQALPPLPCVSAVVRHSDVCSIRTQNWSAIGRSFTISMRLDRRGFCRSAADQINDGSGSGSISSIISGRSFRGLPTPGPIGHMVISSLGNCVIRSCGGGSSDSQR